MKTIAEIKQLSKLRLEEAEILCIAGKYDGAFYLAGYSVELMLKAKICENFDMDNLFDEDAKITGIKIARESVKKHDLSVLLIYSGLAKKFQLAKASQLKLMETYGLLIARSNATSPNNPTSPSNQKEEKLWSEQARYLPIGSNNANDVEMLIQLLKDDEGLLEWMKNN